jgi:enamine deaminase RidA (YjgF/YER057c/UK114 family)
LAEVLRAQGLAPVREQIFGTIAQRRAVLAQRKAALRARGLAASLPFGYIEGAPVQGGGFAGVQLWAVRAPVRTVRHPGGLGRLWSEGGRCFLYLPAVIGTASDGSLPRDRTRQALRMLRNAKSALRHHGFGFPDVARTWIYLRRILDWYGDFNQVRNALYSGPDFLGARFRKLAPASTGIEGRGDRGHCVMDLLAVRPARRGGQPPARILRRSARQGPAPNYGSAFARAVAIDGSGGRTILVSGTASIDAAGHSVAVGDAQRQSRQTLKSVAAILRSGGAGLEDICTAVLYCKQRSALSAFRAARRRLRTPSFPVIALLADVCRPELEVELEAVAVRVRKQG